MFVLPDSKGLYLLEATLFIRLLCVWRGWHYIACPKQFSH